MYYHLPWFAFPTISIILFTCVSGVKLTSFIWENADDKKGVYTQRFKYASVLLHTRTLYALANDRKRCIHTAGTRYLLLFTEKSCVVVCCGADEN